MFFITFNIQSITKSFLLLLLISIHNLTTSLFLRIFYLFLDRQERRRGKLLCEIITSISCLLNLPPAYQELNHQSFGAQDDTQSVPLVMTLTTSYHLHHHLRGSHIISFLEFQTDPLTGLSGVLFYLLQYILHKRNYTFKM